MSFFMTVCVPSYNRGYIIAKTLDSFTRQTFKDFEVIVVDDGSSDNTHEIVEKYTDILNLKYIYKQNGGKHTALNVAVSNADSELFLIIDAKTQLQEDAIEYFYNTWNSLDNKHEYSGIMGRCNKPGNEIIGAEFKTQPFISSYVDFHYISGVKNGGYGDCSECVRTDLIKQYTWDEDLDTKFIPEAYVFDRIGVDYKLYCVNKVIVTTEYLQDGITQNSVAHRRKNAVGFLLDTISKLQDVFPKVKGISIAIKFKWWVKYWCLLRLCKQKTDLRVKRVRFLGYIAKVASIIVKI